MSSFRGPALSLGVVEGIFQRRQWRYTRVADTLLTSFEHVTMLITVDEARETVVAHVPIVPGRGMAGYRPLKPSAEYDACVYLMARNFGILLGNYGRDHRDGEVRFSVAIPVSSSFLSDEQLEHAILASVGTVTRDANILNALLVGEMPLHQALRQLDGDDSPGAQVV